MAVEQNLIIHQNHLRRMGANIGAGSNNDDLQPLSIEGAFQQLTNSIEGSGLFSMAAALMGMKGLNNVDITDLAFKLKGIGILEQLKPTNVSLVNNLFQKSPNIFKNVR